MIFSIYSGTLEIDRGRKRLTNWVSVMVFLWGHDSKFTSRWMLFIYTFDCCKHNSSFCGFWLTIIYLPSHLSDPWYILYILVIYYKCSPQRIFTLYPKIVLVLAKIRWPTVIKHLYNPSTLFAKHREQSKCYFTVIVLSSSRIKAKWCMLLFC